MTDIDLLTSLSFTEKEYLRLVPCVRVTLYLDTIAAAEVIEYCDAALTLLRPKLAYYLSGSMRRPAAMADKASGIVASWFRRPREGISPYFAMFTGADEEGTSPATLRIVINYRAPRIFSAEEIEVRRERRRVLNEERGAKLTAAVSEITLTMPLEMEAAHPEPLRRWLLERPLITETAFASGHAGLGLNHDGPRKLAHLDELPHAGATRSLRRDYGSDRLRPRGRYLPASPRTADTGRPAAGARGYQHRRLARRILPCRTCAPDDALEHHDW